MPKIGKRQSQAGLRLKKEFPDIHAELVAGRIPSLKKALLKAGLASKSTPAEKLLKAWGKANAEERNRFLVQIGARRAVSAEMIASAEAETILIANGRYLLPQTVQRIEAIMKRRSLLPTHVAREVGFPTEGRSLTRALAKNASLRLAVIAALDDWLRKQG